MDERVNGLKTIFANIPLRARLLIMVAPLTLALLAFIVIQVEQAWQRKGVANGAYFTAELAVAIGDAVHDLQHERGLSATYLENPDRSLRTQLTGKHSDTEETLAALKQRLRDRSALAETGVSIAGAERGIERVPQFRRQVLSQSMNADAAVESYSRVIANLIGVVERLAETMPAGTLADTTRTLTRLIGVQEAAGKERAALSRATATGTLPLPLRDTAIGLASEQAVLVHLARESAPAAVADRVTDQRADRVRALRERIFAGNVGSVSQQQWWQAASERIDGLFQSQEAVNDYLLTVAKEQRVRLELTHAGRGPGRDDSRRARADLDTRGGHSQPARRTL